MALLTVLILTNRLFFGTNLRHCKLLFSSY